MFLGECKYVVKEKKVSKYIIHDIEILSDPDREDSDEENSDKDNSDEENSDEQNCDEQNYKITHFLAIYKNVNRILSKNKEKGS